MEDNKLVLYSYFRSSCSWRVRIALALKNIDYESRFINLVKGEHLSESYVKLNPCGEVPALVTGTGQTITHSVAILEYLEETVPLPPLLPQDSVLRAQVRAIVDTIASGIQPIQNMKVLKYVGQDSQQWAKHWIQKGFVSLEKILGETHGQYCVGDALTMADVCLLPQIYNANRFAVDMSQFPLIAEIASRLSELDAFRLTRPENQPDCPEELKRHK
ncbi:maleylacetoacetate isomerase [Parasteatoda tepidariorum]|uniref:maleylacetoacetate isomerase n=1 Tax=Parasteatoda tepidariorum TaxID=114398 RepID=UPI001C725933|nr:maleylacetoacetate isomerase [Parasteatoda tepidariorum]